MNLIQSLLCQTLHTEPTCLRSVMREKMFSGPFGCSERDIDALLDASADISDRLWTFSVTLNMPHQWLYDAYRLQRELVVGPASGF